MEDALSSMAQADTRRAKDDANVLGMNRPIGD